MDIISTQRKREREFDALKFMVFLSISDLAEAAAAAFFAAAAAAVFAAAASRVRIHRNLCLKPTGVSRRNGPFDAILCTNLRGS